MSKMAPPLGSASQICFFAPAFAQHGTFRPPPYPNLALRCTAPTPVPWAGASVLAVFGGWWWVLRVEGACGPGLPHPGRKMLPAWGQGGGNESCCLGLKFISNSLSF